MINPTATSTPTHRYHAVVSADQRNTSHTQVAELVATLGPGPLRILEVGCSSGYLSAYLKTFGHWVTGVEPSASAAATARAVLDEVHEGDFDSYLAVQQSRQPFDVVVFADVLEHLDEPARTLHACRALIGPGGCVAISVPNVTHGGIRGMLLEGRWTYAELGILDRTHLRFFSRDGLIDLIDDAAFVVVELRRTIMTLEAINQEYATDLSPGTIALVQSAARDDDVETFQFIALAKPAAPSEQPAAANAPWRSGLIASASGVGAPISRGGGARMRLRAIARLFKPG